ncbi:MAG: response regulator [Proteobacteria bacterium]|nr:response regulator [Pseudomonadota bacterium]MBU4580895.1 response regulator [Pseudomonadota bacterium]MCG2740052.1 response regulator [Syntrophaceae bacterium]
MADQVKILVIDDEQIMRDGCARILSKNSCSVLTAENGSVGLAKIQESPKEIDIILLDLMMPGMSGMEVLEKIQALDDTLLIIIITGYATVASAVEAMKKGAYDFIAKPFTPDQLRIVVKRALERRMLQKEAEFLRSERERSLRDVATEKSRVKTIINCMGDGILVCDRDSCIVLANPAAGRMLEIPESRLLGNYVSQSNLHSELSRTIEDSLKTEESAYTSISQELIIGDSREIFLRAHTAPVRNDLGEVMGAVTVLQDISYLKELDKMKSEFIAMVAHELRAPIATVEQQLTVIIGGMAGELNEKQQQMIARAKERTSSVLTLIKDLLDFSKIEAGKMVQYKEPLSLAEVIPRVVEAMKADAAAKNIHIEFLPPLSSSIIQADQNSMEGIFNNLISNAIKYTPDGGRVTISLADDDGFVKVSVTDTGIGINGEDIPRIFDKFYRVKSSDTRQIVGTGLGLSIVKSIVDAHMGTISVESTEGKGTTFSVLLPKAADLAGCAI